MKNQQLRSLFASEKASDDLAKKAKLARAPQVKAVEANARADMVTLERERNSSGLALLCERVLRVSAFAPELVPLAQVIKDAEFRVLRRNHDDFLRNAKDEVAAI